MCKLTDKGIEVVGWKVPRRDKSKFAKDVFKDVRKRCEYGGGKEWGEGKDFVPIMESLDPNSKNEGVGESGGEEPPPPPVDDTPTPPSRLSSVKFNNMASKFRHVYGRSKPKQNWYYNLQTNVSTMDGSLLTSGGGLWACPWKGGGGKVYVGVVGKEGKVAATPELLNTGHTKQVTALGLGGGEGRVLVTGSDDCNVGVWRIDGEGGEI